MENNRYIAKNENATIITNEGYEYLKDIVTDPYGPIYAFKNTSDPVLTAAAMARLSRRGDDLRLIYLDEFVNFEENADVFLKKVVSGFGDDSVKQLIFLPIAVEEASNLLTKRLEWGRFAGYLEQSTRYIYFDKPDKDGKFKYFIPANLPVEIHLRYISDMDAIFHLYSDMVRKITDVIRIKKQDLENKMGRTAWLGATRAEACDASRPALPVATKSTVGIVATAQSIESLILHLSAENLPEAVEAGKSILRESRKVISAFLERADMPAYGGAWIVHRKDTKSAMEQLAKKYLPNFPVNSEEVMLLDYWPKNELSLVPEMLFESSTLPLKMIKNRVKDWPLAQKLEVFNAYMGQRLNRRHKPGRALEKAHYEWQITADYGTFRDLQRHRVVDMMEWQKLTTAYGYDVPMLVKEALLENKFQRCFEISKNLYDLLVCNELEEEAQYATLLGHKMRYRFMENAREAFHLHELRTGPEGHPNYRKIVNEMHEKLSKVHPVIGAAMIFVNKSENPELTRMASEMATQRKLALLEKQ